MAQYNEQTLPGLGIPGPVGATEPTTGQQTTGSGVTATDLTSRQLASGSKYACAVCQKRKYKLKGKIRNITMLIRKYLNEIKKLDVIDGIICQKCYNEYQTYYKQSGELVSNQTSQTGLSQEIGKVKVFEDTKELTGHTTEQIKELTNKYIRTTKIKSSEIRNREQAVIIYLTKLRRALTNQELAKIYNISLNNIKNCVKKVREELYENMVKQKLGLNNMSREVLASHNSPMVNALHCQTPGSVSIMADGTYIYIQKSADNEFQWKTFSVQKGRHLVKPMILICSDGYIIDGFGPYEATKNDATIMTEILEKEKDQFERLFRHGDVVIVDRGFRDAKAPLEQRGFIVKMPTCTHSHQAKLTTKQANETRIITAVRWRIEYINGKLKQYKLLDKVRPNRTLQSLRPDCRIACALINEYFKPMETDQQTAIDIVDKMLKRLPTQNRLLEEVDSLNLDKHRKNFKTLTSEDCPEFPKLTKQDLADITLGSYQIKMAKLYVSAHLDNEGKYSFQICTDQDEPGLLRVEVHSRHKHNTFYKVYVKYQPNGRGSDAIIGYVCRCKVGSRTVGCCSHITSVLWFLGYARYKGQIKRPARDNLKIFAPSDVEDSD